MDEDLKNRIADYFESWQLAEYLNLSSLDIIDAFEDDVLANINELEELMGVNDDSARSD